MKTQLAYIAWVVLTVLVTAKAGLLTSFWAALAVFGWMVVTQLILLNLAWWDVRTDGYVLRKGDDRRWRVGVQRTDGKIDWLDGRRP